MKRILLLLFCILPLIVVAQAQKVAILEPVDKEGNISYGIKLMLRSNLSKAVANTHGYEVYDRSDIDAVMKESNFQRTGDINDKQLKSLGQMTGANIILVTEAAKVDEQNIFITAKIINIETNNTESMDDEIVTVSAPEIKRSSEILVSKLFGSNSATMESSKNSQNQTQCSSEIETLRQVGDLYTFSDGSKGVIFYLTGDNHGLVVSLDEFSAKWENERRARGCHDIAMLPNEENGVSEMTFGLGYQNTQYIIQALGPSEAPAAEWCTRHGEGWYLPSSGELWYLFSEKCDISVINQSIESNGGAELTKAWYWSSTECSDEGAINVSFKGKMDAEEKTEELNVRAMRAF